MAYIIIQMDDNLINLGDKLNLLDFLQEYN